MQVKTDKYNDYKSCIEKIIPNDESPYYAYIILPKVNGILYRIDESLLAFFDTILELEKQLNQREIQVTSSAIHGSNYAGLVNSKEFILDVFNAISLFKLVNSELEFIKLTKPFKIWFDNNYKKLHS